MQVQKKSEAQVHQFQPKLTPPQKAAVERNLDADERALLNEVRRGSRAEGGFFGFILGAVSATFLVLYITTALFQPVADVTARGVAIGVAQDGR